MTAALFGDGAAEVELALRATLLIGAAWAAAAALRKAGASAATRHMAWLLGIAALLALPLFWWLAPPLHLPILRPEAAIAPAASPPPPTIAAATAAPGSVGWNDALLVAYLLGVAVLLLRFALCRHMVARLWRDAEPAPEAWQDLLCQVLREMRLSRPVELRIARGPAMPMTWGTLAPKVLLPAEAGAWPPGQRRLVLLHELAHVARRDSLSRSAASLACALYWFHPGAWFATRQMRMEQEYAADDRVLTAGAAARTYALSLLQLARRVGEGSRPDHAAAMAGMCQLERRVASITAPAPRERPGPAFLYASAAIATSVTLAVAAGVPVKPLSALASPRMQPALLAARVAPAPAADRSKSEMQATPRAERVSRRESSPSDVRDGFEEPGTVVPILQADGRASEAEGQRVEPAAQGLETVLRQPEPIGRDWREAPAYAHPLATYGPQLPRQDVEGQAVDARIPELLRRSDGNSGSRSRPAASRRRSGLFLSFGPSWP